MDRIKLYSPTQVLVASFVGGPIAAVYVLWSNFRALGKEDAARQTMIWGVVFVVTIFALLPIIPERFPNYVIPIGYAVGARFLAGQYQMSKEAIAQSDRYGFHSGWNVFGLSVAGLIVFFILALAWMLALDHFGIVTL